MLLILLACVSDNDLTPVGTVEEEPDEPTPYVLDDEEEDEAVLLELEALRLGIEEAIDVSFQLDPVELHEAYESLRYGDYSACPYYYDSYYDLYGYYYWVDTCSSNSGWSFTGNGRSYSYGPYVDGSSDYAYRNYFYGAARIDTPDGLTFVGSGYANNYQYTNTSNGYSYHYSNLSGDFRWDGALDTWLGQDLQVALYTYAYRSPDGGTATSLSGSLTGLQGEVNTAVFDGVFLYDEVLGSPCSLEPSGIISLRDEDGQWYDVHFDGPESGATAMWPPDCDGCGKAWHEGELLGAVCPDFDRMIVWPEERPW